MVAHDVVNGPTLLMEVPTLKPLAPNFASIRDTAALEMVIYSGNILYILIEHSVNDEKFQFISAHFNILLQFSRSSLKCITT